MKILLVTESFLPSLNGVTITVMRTLEYLADHGHDVVLVCPAPNAPRTYAGFPVIEVPSFSFKGMRVGFPTRLLTMVMDGFQPDIVHIAAPFSLGFHAVVAANSRGIPTTAVYQTDIVGFARRNKMKPLMAPAMRWIDMIHARADVNLAPSTPAVDDLATLGVYGAYVWPHGVEADHFHPRHRLTDAGRAMRARFSPTGRPVVGYVGRLAPEKEVERLAALADLDCELVVVGDGIAASKVERALPTAHFTGRMTGDDLATAYACLDVFVHTGRWETFGLTVQEAMACGVPVVAPAEGGPLDTVQHGTTGFLYDPDRPAQMHEQVAALVADPELRARMGEAGRRRALTRTWDAVNDELIGFWELARETRTERESRRAYLPA